MWPFKSKESIAAREARDKDRLKRMREKEDAVFIELPLSSEFDYMGVRFTVTDYIRFEAPFIVPGYYYEGRAPGMRCDYVDSHGVLHNISFSLREMESIAGLI